MDKERRHLWTYPFIAILVIVQGLTLNDHLVKQGFNPLFTGIGCAAMVGLGLFALNEYKLSKK